MGAFAFEQRRNERNSIMFNKKLPNERFRMRWIELMLSYDVYAFAVVLMQNINTGLHTSADVEVEVRKLSENAFDFRIP